MPDLILRPQMKVKIFQSRDRFIRTDFFFTFSQSFKKSDLLENELPDVQSKVILQVCGAFGCFAWQNVLN